MPSVLWRKRLTSAFSNSRTRQYVSQLDVHYFFLIIMRLYIFLPSISVKHS